MDAPTPQWQVFVDTGGTFTDALGVDPRGLVRRAKVLSTAMLRARVRAARAPAELVLDESWGACDDLPRGWIARCGARQAAIAGFESRGSILKLAGAIDAPPGSVVEVLCPDPAPVLAARLLMGIPGDHPLPPTAMRLATTRGTNALLTGAHPPVAVLLTRGLGDLLEIGTQQRPDLFALDIRKPRPIHDAVVELDERLAADGTVVRALDRDALRRDADALLARGVRAAAIALLHADLNPVHELQAEAELLAAGFEVVARSSAVSPFIKVWPRAVTTVVEAALSRVIGGYLADVEAALAGGRLDVLTSAGGLAPAADYRAVDSLLSGPAGGAVGALAAGVEAGEREVLAFDMGGTSTDVSRLAGGVEHTFEHTVGQVTLVAPAVDIHTVAAGGGSICGFDGAALIVGPASAGADPGPACYGRGGPLTLTDVQLLAGRLDASRFRLPLDVHAAEAALQQVLEDARAAAAPAAGELGREQVIDGFLQLAAERIAGAVRVVSSKRGHEPARATLLAFGGAGGQLACVVAEQLGIRRILVPRDAGLLSARGLAAARFEHIVQRQILEPLALCAARLDEVIRSLTEEAGARVRRAIEDAGQPDAPVQRSVFVAARRSGQETPVEAEIDRADQVAGAFEREYERLYGYAPGPGAIEVVWLRVIVRAGRDLLATAGGAAQGPAFEDLHDEVPRQSMRSRGRRFEARILTRAQIAPGARINGPALIADPDSTTIVEDGWSVRAHISGTLVLEPRPGPAISGAEIPAAARTEVFTNRLESMARAMGEALRRTSFSVNVKERLDYSCAILDAAGSLVACAPHVPVHLGSLGVCVRETLRHAPLGPRDVVITNHPACGGSHLPDVTVMAGAFNPAGEPLAYVAARAHHAEIGGTRPGSMPPRATTLAEEGVVIPPMLIVRAGREHFGPLVERFGSGPWPSRAVPANMEDVRAAIAACARGVADLEALAAAAGESALTEMLEAVQARSETAAREALARLGPIDLGLADTLDDGSPLAVRLRSDGSELTVDFTGTAGVHPASLNATPAIVRSCIVYTLRLLCGRDVPLNEGLVRPVRTVLPPGLLNPPFDVQRDPAEQPAVVGGNVETSQRLVNLLVRGLGLAAESQGTMNNLIFGSDTFSYYETIGGGAGAGPGFAGAAAVHTHMTNTRITDPEVLERRCPVRLERFAVRRGSGGAGTFAGGDGLERVLRFLAPVSVSLITQRRVRGPRGAHGGGEGAPGMQWIDRADGSRVALGSSDGAEVRAGGTLTILTPGGGGWGAAAGSTGRDHLSG